MKEDKLHITDQEMQSYIQNKLPSAQRQRVELEIQLCEACLEKFIYWSSIGEVPNLPFIDEAAEQVVYAIELEQLRKKQRWIQRPFAQVAIAAAITLLLVGTGVMSSISNSMVELEEGIERPQIEQLEQSSSPRAEQWLEKATNWLHLIEERRFD